MENKSTSSGAERTGAYRLALLKFARNSGLGIRRTLVAVARLFRGGVLGAPIGENPRL